MRPLLAGLLIGCVATSTAVWAMRERVPNFSDCPPGTTDYCPWTVHFVVSTFWPLLLVMCALGVSAAISVQRFRGKRTTGTELEE